MKVLETDRLVLRELESTDDAFILQLLNDPSWLRYIGDKNVRSLDDAKNYILTGPVDMYLRLGFGLWLVELKHEHVPAGLCGLIKREALDDVDLGFAFLPGFRNKGYAFEAASATLEYARTGLQLSRIAAIASQDNQVSCGLLVKLGFRYERLVRLSPDGDELKFFTIET